MVLPKTKFFIVIVCMVILVTIYSTWLFKNNEISIKHSENNVKYILFWTPYWSRKDYFMDFGFKGFSKCEYKNCFTTDNRSFLSVDEFDAILFHGNVYDEKLHQKPSVRSPNQIYLYVSVEAPIHHSPNLSLYDSYFNWTMTYRFDSEILKRYRSYAKNDTKYVFPSMDFFRNKTKMMAWFVSHCRTSGRREVLMKEVMKYIPVDVYGKCGPLKCGRTKEGISLPGCYRHVEENYKFYFSGENSFCKDYTTEKLYYLLQRNIVPVVYGGGDYNAIAPPKSVINVIDFHNVTHLVDYLKFLDANTSEYLKYFEWKKHYTPFDISTACQLCKKLNAPLKTRIIKDLHQWFWGVNNDFCKANKTLPAIVSDLL